MCLRAILGCVVLIQGTSYLYADDPTETQWAVGVTIIAGGVLLLVGFLTPIAGGLVGLCGIGMLLSLIPSSSAEVLNSTVTDAFAATTLVAVIVLGPGGYSVDAHLFGRREVIIPQPIQRKS